MDFLTLLLVVLGIAMIVCLLYLVLTDTPVPPALRVVVLVGVAVMLLLCVTHAVGCPTVPVPH
jgi:peptidoglycan/LPS O-acetylase OafA/YrhL